MHLRFVDRNSIENHWFFKLRSEIENSIFELTINTEGKYSNLRKEDFQRSSQGEEYLFGGRERRTGCPMEGKIRVFEISHSFKGVILLSLWRNWGSMTRGFEMAGITFDFWTLF
jgi:hypothetical protein